MMIDPHSNPRRLTVDELQQQIRRMEQGTTATAMSVRGTGCRGLDALFPSNGVRPGSLVEWLGVGAASGAGTLSLVVARNIGGTGRPLVVIDTQHQVFAISLATLGVDLSQVVIVRPESERDALWTCEEALRCQEGGLVWAHLGHLSGTAARRLRLAAEDTASTGLLVRSVQAIRQPSWAEVRLLVEPRLSPDESLHYHVSVAYSQGRPTQQKTDIQLEHMRGVIHEPSPARSTHPLSLVS